MSEAVISYKCNEKNNIELDLLPNRGEARLGVEALRAYDQSRPSHTRIAVGYLNNLLFGAYMEYETQLNLNFLDKSFIATDVVYEVLIKLITANQNHTYNPIMN